MINEHQRLDEHQMMIRVKEKIQKLQEKEFEAYLRMKMRLLSKPSKNTSILLNNHSHK